MGVEPFLVSSAVSAVLAQRLARRLCDCKQEVVLPGDAVRANGYAVDGDVITAFEPAGCARCGGTGYKGRVGLYEVMPVNDEIRRLAVTRASADAIAEAAIRAGMRPLRAEGLQKVLAPSRDASETFKSRRRAAPRLPGMKQSVSLITLGVADYARAKAFYEAIGWSPAMDVEETAFFQCNGVVLTLWARDKLAADMGIPDDGARWGGVALAHNVGSDAEVDRIVAEARANGAEVCREPAPTFYGGYAGAFRDLDGHVWEVAHNPGFGLTEDGAVVLPEG
jgi:predicted lactoylglutathione lyase